MNNEIQKLREHIRDTLRNIKKKQKISLYEKNLQEYKLRKTIRSLIKEAEDIVTHESTGINVLADLLETIVPILKSFYKKLGTDIEQRKSFRAHTIKSVQNLLAPVAVMFKAGGTVGKPDEVSTAPEQNELVEAELEEKIKVKTSKAEQDPAFIPLKADRKEAEDTKKQDKSEPKPEEVFVPIEGEDETGRNIALQSFKRVEKQIREAYTMLANEEDRELFYDYLITNLKLYFDKFEDELQSTVPEPTTPEYEAEKKKKEAGLQSAAPPEGGQPAAEPTAEEAPLPAPEG
jgi:hypothetical protein